MNLTIIKWWFPIRSNEYDLYTMSKVGVSTIVGGRATPNDILARAKRHFCLFARKREENFYCDDNHGRRRWYFDRFFLLDHLMMLPYCPLTYRMSINQILDGNYVVISGNCLSSGSWYPTEYCTNPLLLLPPRWCRQRLEYNCYDDNYLLHWPYTTQSCPTQSRGVFVTGS